MERSAILDSMRSHARQIFEAGLKAADPADAVRRHFKRDADELAVNARTYHLKSFDHIYVIGAGKASACMAEAVEKILEGRITSGWINVKYGHTRPLERIVVHEAGHPVPDQEGYLGSQKILEILENAGSKDLVIVLLSGGGSALLPNPSAGLSLKDKQETTQVLLDIGADISEINSIRKHLSGLKGGRLARRAFPAPVVALILSDVIGDRLSSIASGPTVPDESTYLDCQKILSKYGIEKRIPLSVRKFIERGAGGGEEETLKPEDPVFLGVQNVIVGSNFQALQAARKKAVDLGYATLLLSSSIEGETREIARMHAAIAEEILRSGNPLPCPACIISGGETTVNLKGGGLGGRNQEFVLAAAIASDALKDVVILSCGTDGTDGPTDAAGAVADGQTLNLARSLGLEAERFLAENDSYHFFQALDDLVVTGPTLTNVMDIRIFVIR